MKIKIFSIFVFLIILFFIVSAFNSEKTYVFRIQKEGLYIRPVSLNLFDSPFSESSNFDKGAYIARLVGKGEPIYSVRFDLYSLIMTNPTEECFRDPQDPSCEEEIYIYGDFYADVVLNFPYHPKADSIEVYNEKELMFIYELPRDEKSLLSNWYYLVLGLILIILVLFFIKNKKTNHTINPS